MTWMTWTLQTSWSPWLTFHGLHGLHWLHGLDGLLWINVLQNLLKSQLLGLQDLFNIKLKVWHKERVERVTWLSILQPEKEFYQGMSWLNLLCLQSSHTNIIHIISILVLKPRTLPSTTGASNNLGCHYKDIFPNVFAGATSLNFVTIQVQVKSPKSKGLGVTLDKLIQVKVKHFDSN